MGRYSQNSRGAVKSSSWSALFVSVVIVYLLSRGRCYSGSPVALHKSCNCREVAMGKCGVGSVFDSFLLNFVSNERCQHNLGHRKELIPT